MPSSPSEDVEAAQALASLLILPRPSISAESTSGVSAVPASTKRRRSLSDASLTTPKKYRRHSIAGALPMISTASNPSLSPLDEDDEDGLRVYPRTPELRVSHKLAERRRRQEMKALFDELRVVLDIEEGVRGSKWEVLKMAIDTLRELKGMPTPATSSVEPHSVSETAAAAFAGDEALLSMENKETTHE